MNECSNCGKCCSNILLISEQEKKKIKKFIRENHIKPLNTQNVLMSYQDICPFRNNKEHKCEIYSVRPEICQKFQCYKAEKENLNYKIMQAENMLKLFYPQEYCEDTTEQQLELNKKINKFNKEMKGSL